MQSDVSRTILFGLVQGPSPVGLCRARFPFGSCVAAPREARRAKRGGARRDRTDDLMLAKHALSQLSYGPEPEDECSCRMPVFAQKGYAGHASLSSSVAAPRVAAGEAWWAWEDLNFRPHAYQARALTN